MKKTRKPQGTVLILLSCILAISSQTFAAGLLQAGSQSEAGMIWLKSHKVSVKINNGFARTEVDQVFHNDSSRDLEAVYSFPVPENASLSELSLWINGKEVIGEVLEKQRARQIYQQETRKKIDPALAEKENNIFKVSVCPVVAKDDTRVRLVYYQPINIELNIGRYVYPLSDFIPDEEDQSSFWSADTNVKEEFSFNLELLSAFPISDVRMPGYADQAKIEKTSSSDPTSPDYSGDKWTATLSPQGSFNLDKDIVFYYKLDDSVPARVELIPFKEAGEKEGTFMLVVTPSADLKPITEGTDWLFLLDTSGSMRGGKLTSTIEGVSNVLNSLNENDRFHIINFSNSAKNLTKDFSEASEESVKDAIDKLESLKATGSTNLYQGLFSAFRSLDKDRTNAVVLITDAGVQANPKEHQRFMEMLQGTDIRLFTFVIGNGGDRPLMKRLSQDSNGFAMSISETDDLTGRVMQAKGKMAYENMRNVQLKFKSDKVKVNSITPADIRSLYRGQQLTVFGRYTGEGELDIELRCKIGDEQKNWPVTASMPQADSDNPELERLWALSNINDIMETIRDEGEKENLRNDVIKLGTEYALVTDYTSMIVLEEDRFDNYNIERKNRDRVQKERTAQQQRSQKPTRNYRVDNTDTNRDRGGEFRRRSPGVGGGGSGSGPVGPLFFGMIAMLRRRKNKNTDK